MRFLKVMSSAEAHEILKACCTTLSKGFDVVNLESYGHVACWDLADAIAFLDSGAQWCRDCSAHMRNRLDVGAIDHQEF